MIQVGQWYRKHEVWLEIMSPIVLDSFNRLVFYTRIKKFIGSSSIGILKKVFYRLCGWHNIILKVKTEWILSLTMNWRGMRI